MLNLLLAVLTLCVIFYALRKEYKDLPVDHGHMFLVAYTLRITRPLILALLVGVVFRVGAFIVEGTVVATFARWVRHRVIGV